MRFQKNGFRFVMFYCSLVGQFIAISPCKNWLLMFLIPIHQSRIGDTGVVTNVLHFYHTSTQLKFNYLSLNDNYRCVKSGSEEFIIRSVLFFCNTWGFGRSRETNQSVAEIISIIIGHLLLGRWFVCSDPKGKRVFCFGFNTGTLIFRCRVSKRMRFNAYLLGDVNFE